MEKDKKSIVKEAAKKAMDGKGSPVEEKETSKEEKSESVVNKYKNLKK